MKSNIKKFSMLISGSIGAQVLSLIVSPIITRIYDPEIVGLFSVVNSIVAILIPLISFSLPIAVILPKSRFSSVNVIKVNLIFSLIMSLMFLLIFSLVIYVIKEKVDYYYYSYFVILLALLTVNIEALNYFLLRQGLYSVSAKAVFIQSLVSNLMKVLFGYYSNDIYSLLFSMLLGLLLSVLFILINIKSGFKLFTSNKIFKYLNIFIMKYKSYPLYRAPQGIIANLNQSLPVFVLGYLYGSEVVGFYALARMVMLSPVAIISKAITDIIYPEVNKRYLDNIPIEKYITKVSIILSIVFIIPSLLFFTFGSEIYSLIFSDKWIVSGEYSKVMSVWLFFSIVNRPFVAVIPTFKLEKYLFYNSVLNSFMCVVGILTGYYLYDSAIGTINSYFLFSIIPQILIVVFVFKKIRRFDKVSINK